MSNITWVEVDFQQFQAKLDCVNLYAGINDDGSPYWSLGSLEVGRVARSMPQVGISDPMAYANACIRNMQAESEAAARKWLED